MFEVLKVWLTVLVIVGLTNAANDEIQFRVVGGYRPEKHTLAKYMVSLRYRNDKFKYGHHGCGGSILSPKTILTAAHCVDFISNAEEIFISAGSTLRLIKEPTTQFIDVAKIVLHEGYTQNFATMKHDIAILQLVKGIVEDGITAQRIPIASGKTAAGRICTAAGWGKFVPNGPSAAEVTYLDLDIMSNKMCRKLVGLEFLHILKLRLFHIRKTVICLAPNNALKGACQGDSGGPLFCDGTVIGIASFVEMPCGSGFSIYTSVYHYRDWIEKHSIN